MLYDNFEGYKTNEWWFFYIYLMAAAEICQDKDYIQKRYHPEEILPIVKNVNKRRSKNNSSKIEVL